MKKLIILVVFAIIGWTSFYDVTKGTLNFIGDAPPVSTTTIAQQTKPFKMVKIQPGDTVLSVYEKLNPTTEIAIQKVINDFQALNKGVNPNQIQIGGNYRFPIYSSHKQ